MNLERSHFVPVIERGDEFLRNSRIPLAICFFFVKSPGFIGEEKGDGIYSAEIGSDVKAFCLHNGEV